MKLLYRVSQYLLIFPRNLLLHIPQDFYFSYFIYCIFNDVVGKTPIDDVFID